MTISSSVVERVGRATCAIGWLTCSLEQYAADPFQPRLKVTGTGFLVRPNIVVSARHVLTDLLKRTDDQKRDDPAVVVFFRPTGQGVEARV